MRVFVYDVTGYVGAAVAEVLIDAGHEVVGSVVDKDDFAYGSTGKLQESSAASDVDASNSLLLSAEAVVFPAEGATEQARAALRLLKNGGYEGEKRVIIVSTLMTWARTKQPEDGSGLTEENYSKRKPASRYADLKTLESQCKAVAKENLGTVVIGAGLLYGRGERVLHNLFRQAWMCSPAALPILAGDRSGENKLPMIHVNDLARIVAAACESLPETPYVVAVDNSQSSLKDIVASISSSLGTGETRMLSREETQDLMLEEPSSSNLNLHLTFNVDAATTGSMGIEWEAQEGILESMDSVVSQFKKIRDLRPVRAIVLGPPAGGSHEVAQSLSKKYYVEVITKESAIAAATSEPTAAESVVAEGEEGEPEEPELTEAEAAAKALREEVVEAQSSGNIPDALLCKVIRAKLRSASCRNQGWVLHGFPSTWREAVGVFSTADELEETVGDGDEGEPVPEASEEFKPNGVIVVEMSDDDCRSRAMAEDEGKFEEAAFNEALEAYRKNNADDNERSPPSYFEAASQMETISSSDLNDISLYLEQGKKPNNYHPTRAEKEEMERAAAAAEKERAEAESAAKAQQEKAEAEERARRKAEEDRRLEEIQKRENELLEQRSKPLRAYLMKNVIPTLTDGLIETCRVMPEDPIDYLAEYLFRASPVVEASSGSKTGK